MNNNVLLGFPPLRGRSSSVLECLDSSLFDELSEIDFRSGHFRQLHHVPGKYYVPIADNVHDDLIGYIVEQLIHPDDRAAFSLLMRPEELKKRIAEADPAGVLYTEARTRLMNGRWCWTALVIVGGACNGLPEDVYRLYTYDIRSRKKREAAEEAYSSQQPSDMGTNRQTGLLQGKTFFAAAQEQLDQLDPSADWCMLSVSIEHFDLFNDWYGRQTGERLIAQIGKLLQEAQQSSGIAGYLGKDEFVFLAPFELPRIKRLYACVHELIHSIGSSVGFLPAFGISLTKDSMDVLTLHKEANAAIDYARKHLNTRISIFEASMQEQTDKEYQILFNFQEGLKSHELYFCLQPQCLASNGKIVGAESLARWRRADGTMVPPSEFVPVLEKYGFVIDLDKFIWEEVCSWLHAWILRGNTPLPVSVNVSQIDLYSIDVAEHFDRLVQKYELPRDVIKIEITESAYVDDSAVVRSTVQRLRDLGFLVLMDDFGSGYSSLNMLSNLNVDILKLDARFLHTEDTRNEKGVHILESIVNMAKTLGLPIIVEGVENSAQRDFLQNLGCRYVQGYFFYRPMSVRDFEQLIVVRTNVDLRGFIFVANEQFHVREFLDQTIFSDSMLNSILGPVAIYRLRGDQVDIVRFNEQFHKAVNLPEFQDRLLSIQNYMPEDERGELFAALERAEQDRLNGASCILTFFRTDNTPMRFLMQFYFLSAEENGKKFYGSAHDVTELTRLRARFGLLSRLQQTVFIRRTERTPQRYSVLLHGLEQLLGLPEARLRQELLDGSFCARAEAGCRARLQRLLDGSDPPEPGDFSFRVTADDGSSVLLVLTVDRLCDLSKQLETVFILRKASD